MLALIRHEGVGVIDEAALRLYPRSIHPYLKVRHGPAPVL
jgi:hypothetical protein